jgi:hypothetical protein
MKKPLLYLWLIALLFQTINPLGANTDQSIEQLIDILQEVEFDANMDTITQPDTSESNDILDGYEEEDFDEDEQDFEDFDTITEADLEIDPIIITPPETTDTVIDIGRDLPDDAILDISDDETSVTLNVDATLYINGANPQVRFEQNFEDGTTTVFCENCTWSLDEPEDAVTQQPAAINDSPIPPPPPMPEGGITAGTSGTNSAPPPPPPGLPPVGANTTSSPTTSSNSTTTNTAVGGLLGEIQGFKGFNKKNLKGSDSTSSSNNASSGSSSSKKLSFAEQLAAHRDKVMSGETKKEVVQNEAPEASSGNKMADEIKNFQFGGKTAKYTPKKSSSTKSSGTSSWKKQQEAKVAKNQAIIDEYTEKYGITHQQFINYLQDLLDSDNIMVSYNQVKDSLGISRSEYSKLQQDVKYNLFTDMPSHNGIILSDLQAVPMEEDEVAPDNGNSGHISSALRDRRMLMGYDDDDDDDDDEDDEWDDEWDDDDY